MIYDLTGSVGYLLTTLSRANERQIEDTLVKFGLTRMTWVALVAVGANSLSQPSRIADFLGVDRPTVSRALTSLEKSGLVKRLHTGADARRVSVQITRQGLEHLTQLAPLVRACNEALVAKMSEKDRTALTDLLTQLSATRPSISSL